MIEFDGKYDVLATTTKPIETIAVFYDQSVNGGDVPWPVVSEQPRLMLDGEIGSCGWDRVLTKDEILKIELHWRYNHYPRISRKRKRIFNAIN